MMKLRKSRINLAVGAVLGAAALIPATSFGWSVDVIRGTITSDSGGDTLLFPLYSTVNPVTTSFSTTNTSNRTILAKIRFREQSKSMDVLDFMVIYSPYDKFDFSVNQGVTERPTMSWVDSTCLVGPEQGSNSVQFPAPSPFVDSNEVMSVGHLEVLGMADVTNVWTSGTSVVPPNTSGAISWAAAAKHGTDGKPANCQVFEAWLADPANVATLNQGYTVTTADGTEQFWALEDVPNVLTGRFVLTGVGEGIEAGSDAIGIRNSDLTVARLGDGDTILDVDDKPQIVISAQSNADCDDGYTGTTEGAGNCTSWYTWDGLEWDHPHLGEMYNLANFQYALTAANVAGDWSNNPEFDVGVDWVLSFPNKYAYLDKDATGTGSSGCPSSGWCLLTTTRVPNTYGVDVTTTYNGLSGIWTSRNTGDLCIKPAKLQAWDTEEKQASGTVNVSPGTRTDLELCQELEVFTIAGKDQEVRPSVIQVPERRRTITFTNLTAPRGWALLNIPWKLNSSGFPGDAVTGLIWTSRNTDDPTINNASLTDLQKNVGGSSYQGNGPTTP